MEAGEVDQLGHIRGQEPYCGTLGGVDLSMREGGGGRRREEEGGGGGGEIEAHSESYP